MARRYQERMDFARDFGGGPGHVEGSKGEPAGAYAHTDADVHETMKGGPGEREEDGAEEVTGNTLDGPHTNVPRYGSDQRLES